MAWLYKDFPDFDVVVDFSDHSHPCSHPLPFLKYSTFNMTLANGNALLSYRGTDLISYDTRRMLTASSIQFNKGFTMPEPQAWEALSMSLPQLQHVIECNNAKYPWKDKEDVVFWRGAATGKRTMFPRDLLNHSLSLGGRVHAITNKRIFLTYLSFPYR